MRLSLICLLACFSINLAEAQVPYATLISAHAEWKALKKFYPSEDYQNSPWGEFFRKKIADQEVLFFHEGWGKVAAAGATQYVIDHFNPGLLINLGTCGGIEGQVRTNDVILADETVIYDILEAMGDSKEAIQDYSTKIDLTWLGTKYPVNVRKSVLVSGDRDLRSEELERLKSEYGAIAGDWESGAIAYTAQRNNKKVLILRGVTDIVNTQKGEAYGNLNLFQERTEVIMKKLLNELPLWIQYIESHAKK